MSLPERKKHFLLFLFFLSPLFIFNGYAKSGYTLKDTLLIKEYYDQLKRFDQTNTYDKDSIFYYLNKALYLSDILEYDEYNFRLYKQYSYLSYHTENYPEALFYQHKARNQLEKQIGQEKDSHKFIEEYVRSCITTGGIYFHLKEPDKALTYFEKALKENEKLQSNERFDLNESITVIYNSMMAIYIEKKEIINARSMYEKAMLFIDNIENGEKIRETLRAVMYNNMGIVHRELKEYDKAIEYYNKAIDIYTKYEEEKNIPQVYNNIANIYDNTGEQEKAIQLLKESIEMCEQYSNITSERVAIGNLANIYTDQKDYYNALLTTQKQLTLIENLLKQEIFKRINQLEDHHQYEKFIEQETLKQEVLIAQKEKKVFMYMTIIIVLLFITMTLLFFYRNSKIKVKQQELQSRNLELEKHNLKLQNKELTENIDTKNKELTTHVMYLNQKNSFIFSITEQLMDISKNIPQAFASKLLSIIRQMRKNADQNSWEEFELRFQQVHKDFYKNLNEMIPNLTLNEKRLCAFLRLNMTTKEIASVTYQSVKSIQLARMRLRKKLQVEKDENLISILQKL